MGQGNGTDLGLLLAMTRGVILLHQSTVLKLVLAPRFLRSRYKEAKTHLFEPQIDNTEMIIVKRGSL